MTKRRLPGAFLVVAVNGACVPMSMIDAGVDAGPEDAGSPDASVFDAGPRDAGRPDAGRDAGLPYDAGCALPSDFPPDTPEFIAIQACACTQSTLFHCFEENGPRCISWSCPPARAPDGGYEYTADGGIECLC